MAKQFVMNLKKNILLLSKWILICALIGFLSGTASAFFLVVLQWATDYRTAHHWIVWFLPIGGFFIGLSYYYWGKDVVKGNNLLLEEYQHPRKTIPLKMAPLVFFGTIITHLFGGSAGREGTAVQMGGAIADQFKKIFNLTDNDRKTLIILGISAGFASVFGTPLTGAIFAVEVLFFSKINYKAIPFSFLAAYVAYYTVALWQVNHTHYAISFVPELNFTLFLYTIVVGVLCGLAALFFSRGTHFWADLFKKHISYPPLRPFVGGFILVLAFWFLPLLKYEGLGIPVIVDAFTNTSDWQVFLLKILLTTFTLGAGFKGGEVTPLFFVGATLGSALSLVIPLPIALLAGMGFVAVFSGATHTPIACTVMGMELFGIECGVFVGIACIVAYFASGSVGIYESQIVKGPKYHLYKKMRKTELKNL